MELSQSRKEQREYLKNVELARVLNKRAENKRKAGQDVDSVATSQSKRPRNERADAEVKERKPRKSMTEDSSRIADKQQLDDVLGSIF